MSLGAPAPRRPLKSLELDTAPHRLLNGFIVSIAVGAAVFMGVRGVRAVADIYPEGGLPSPPLRRCSSRGVC